MYGLTEIYRDQIKPARLVANPGCYPTSVQLPLYPLLKDKLIKPEDIIIDSKSGNCMRTLYSQHSFTQFHTLSPGPLQIHPKQGHQAQPLGLQEPMLSGNISGN